MKKVILATLALAPAFAFAQTLGNVETFVRSIGRLVDLALPIVVGIALLVFFWGIFQFISSETVDAGREEGKRKIFWGIFGMFIMISAYGLIRLILGTFGIPTPSYPFNSPAY